MEKGGPGPEPRGLTVSLKRQWERVNKESLRDSKQWLVLLRR
jgi:hypothetical protein